jgi:hypothetical protein
LTEPTVNLSKILASSGIGSLNARQEPTSDRLERANNLGGCIRLRISVRNGTATVEPDHDAIDVLAAALGAKAGAACARRRSKRQADTNGTLMPSWMKSRRRASAVAVERHVGE